MHTAADSLQMPPLSALIIGALGPHQSERNHPADGTCRRPSWAEETGAGPAKGCLPHSLWGRRGLGCPAHWCTRLRPPVAEAAQLPVTAAAQGRPAQTSHLSPCWVVVGPVSGESWGRQGGLWPLLAGLAKGGRGLSFLPGLHPAGAWLGILSGDPVSEARSICALELLATGAGPSGSVAQGMAVTHVCQNCPRCV